MTTPSSKSSRVYARFIPSEEVGDVTQWKFGAVDGSEPVPEEAPEPAPPDPALIEAEYQQALAQARTDAFAEGQAQFAFGARKLVALEDVAERHSGHRRIGDFNAHHGFAWDGGFDAD